MPHTQIVFVKLKMELFEDDRFLFDLNDKQKLLFLLMLGLAGKTNNRVRNEINFIKTRLNLESLHIKDLEKISQVFPKFKLENNYWIFDNFEEHHNWYSGSTEVVPKYSQKKNRIRKEVSNDDFLKTLKQNTAYKHIDIDSELAKMDAWLSTKPGRKKTQRFILGWLNRVEKPIEKQKDTFGTRKLVL